MTLISEKSKFENMYGFSEQDLDFDTPMKFAHSIKKLTPKMNDMDADVLGQFIEMYLNGAIFTRKQPHSNDY